MSPIMMTLAIVSGLVLLALSGEVLVRGAAGLAKRLGVSPFVIGAVVVGFGTSAPELMASVSAALAGAPGVSLGNVVGSNIANCLLIAGAAAMIAPIATPPAALGRDALWLAGATLGAVAVILIFNPISWGAGLILTAGLAAYLTQTIRGDMAEADGPVSALHAAEAERAGEGFAKPALEAAALLGGIVGVVLGARFLVSGGVAAAESLGVSEAVIGLTVVAIGTSLPELAASGTAALRGRGDVALGNIIGSSIFNALGILGVTALVTEVPAPPEMRMDFLFLILATTGLLVAVFTDKRLSRLEGVILIGAYAAYMMYVALGAGRG